MNTFGRTPLALLAGVALGATLSGCGSGRGALAGAPVPAAHDSTPPLVDSLAAFAARAARDSAADQRVLDSLHRPRPAADSLRASPPAPPAATP